MKYLMRCLGVQLGRPRGFDPDSLQLTLHVQPHGRSFVRFRAICMLHAAERLW
jgi:hypothetical protein